MASLKDYASKRNLKKSTEPPARRQSSSEYPRFCVQKHAARHLHYDLRLEYRGVLLSWAVPKGPSLNPKDKRLAIKVEDHPIEYQYFQGVIPKGNYGAGTVEIWDQGTFHAVNTATPEDTERSLTQGLKKGHLSIILDGETLKGEFVLQKLKQSDDDKAWLLIKKKDLHASAKESIVSSHKKKPQRMPTFIAPMLGTLIDEPFDDENWLFEIKWDGYRALAFVNKGEVELKSRTRHQWNSAFPTIIQSLKKIPGQVILDGELVVLDKEGKPDFQAMQEYRKKPTGTLCYYVFDILHKNGVDLRELPLITRKDILKKYMEQLTLPLVRYCDHVLVKGKAFFGQVAKAGLEGMMGKRISSTYQSKRSADWVKIKTSSRQEVVIGGFTAPRGSRKRLGALLVGVYTEDDKLQYVGHVGGGFDASMLEDIYHKLQAITRKTSPFQTEPKPNAPVTWVKPQLVCEVSFAAWTKDHQMRQPIFHGLRSDKKAKSVTKESSHPSPKAKTQGIKKSKVTLTNLDKVFWPEENYTKGDLLAYYEAVAPCIIPYLRGRPIMLHRYPDGIEGKEFYQKDLPEPRPGWIKTCEIRQEGKINHYLLINNVSSLLYAVNLGSIDLHPFISRCRSLENPDYCVIDLDPQNIPFDKVVEAAIAIHRILEEIKIKHYCKTSGGRGLHIMIPLHGKYDYDESRWFAEVICNIVHDKLPRTTSLERSPSKRSRKIYLDCLQNRHGQTIVAPYAVRPRPHALVSTPLTWKEVNEKLDPAQFTIHTISERLKKLGDILSPILKEHNNLKTALKLLKGT